MYIKKSFCQVNGFTLVEMSVVIVVIGIIASLGFLAYGETSKKIAVVTLQSDLEQASAKLESDKNFSSGDPYPQNAGALPKSLNTQYTYTILGSNYCLSATSVLANATYHISSYHKIVEEGLCSMPNFVVTSGGKSRDEGHYITIGSDGGYVVTGETYSYSNTGTSDADMFIAKYYPDGTQSWFKTWGGVDQNYTGNQDGGNCIINTSDGGYAVAGFSNSYNDNYDYDVILVKYTSDGVLQWSKTWGGSGYEQARSVVQSSDDGYVVTGYTYSYGDNGDVFLAKFDTSGVLQWSKTWGGSGSETGYSLDVTGDGGYIVTGETDSYGVGTDVFLAKFDTSGVLQWSKTWGGSYYDSSESIIVTSDGGYAITGFADNISDGDAKIFLAKFDVSGALQWAKKWGENGYGQGRSVIESSGGGYVIGGFTYSYGAGASDVLLAKFDVSGALQWSKTWGGDSYDYSYSVVEALGGGYAVAGVTSSYHSDGHVLLAKFDSLGNIPGCAETMCQTPAVSVADMGYSVSDRSVVAANFSPSIILASPSPVVASPSPNVSVIVDIQ